MHGCFWHGHKGCKYFVVPKTRTDWWLNKINANISNDTKAIMVLKKEGWKIINLWDCKVIKAFSSNVELLFQRHNTVISSKKR